MPWVKLDDRFPSHRKIALLSDRAFRLHVSAICWCSENLTDGRITDRELQHVAHIRGLKATAKQLEDAGVWGSGAAGCGVLQGVWRADRAVSVWGFRAVWHEAPFGVSGTNPKCYLIVSSMIG